MGGCQADQAVQPPVFVLEKTSQGATASGHTYVCTCRTHQWGPIPRASPTSTPRMAPAALSLLPAVPLAMPAMPAAEMDEETMRGCAMGLRGERGRARATYKRSSAQEAVVAVRVRGCWGRASICASHAELLVAARWQGMIGLRYIFLIEPVIVVRAESCVAVDRRQANLAAAVPVQGGVGVGRGGSQRGCLTVRARAGPPLQSAPAYRGRKFVGPMC